MAEEAPSGTEAPNPVSHFIIGTVSEENSEDEILGRTEVPLEDKDRSLSPCSISSDGLYEPGLDHIDGPLHNMRSDPPSFTYFSPRSPL